MRSRRHPPRHRPAIAATAAAVTAVAGGAALLIGRRGPPPGPPIQAVIQPQALPAVCLELGGRSGTTTFAEWLLRNLRVCWAYSASSSQETVLERLAELVDGPVCIAEWPGGRTGYSLGRKAATVAREAAWRRESCRRALAARSDAADGWDHGRCDPSAVPAMQSQLRLERGPLLRYARDLQPEQWDDLIDGKPVPIPPGALRSGDVNGLVEAVTPDSSDSKDRDGALRARLESGFSMQLTPHWMESGSPLVLSLDDEGPGLALCAFGDNEIGLPLSHANPYRMLDKRGAATRAWSPPPAFRRPLERDVVLPEDGRWASALRGLAQVAHLDLTSDAYLCRLASTVRTPPGEVLAPRGTPIWVALDKLCARYHYLWWERNGAVYLRSRTWFWDEEYEPPETFLRFWAPAKRRAQPIDLNDVRKLASLTPRQLDGLTRLGGRTSESTPPQVNELQEFLSFFRTCSGLEQEQVLGPGLVVTPGDGPGGRHLARPQVAELPRGPFLVRLTGSTRPGPASGDLDRVVTLKLRRSWPGVVKQTEFTISFPRLSQPFVPEFQPGPAPAPGPP